MLMCAIFSIVANLGLTYMESVAQLYVFYFVGGLAIGTVFAPIITACILLMPADKQGIAAGLASVSYPLGSALASGPVTWIIQKAGFHWAFAVQGSLAVVTMIIAFFVFPRDKTAGEAGSEQMDQQDSAVTIRSIDSEPKPAEPIEEKKA